MAYGTNRAGGQPRAHFRQAGGSIIKFRHPYFAGQIDTAGGTAIDEIDISACCKLEGRFFEANQNMDSAKQEVMIDGSTVTITNKMLNGTITIPAVVTTGELPTGDFIAGCQLIRSIGDSVGGVITKTDFINGKALTKVYYGVTVKTCPDDISEGNAVAVYNVQLLYAGWIQAESANTDLNKKAIWSVGAQYGIKGIYSPYSIQNVDGITGTGTNALTATALAPNGDANLADDTTGGADNNNEASDAISATFSDLIKNGEVFNADGASEAGAGANTDSSANNP